MKGNRKDHKSILRMEAETRNADWAAKSPEEQLRLLPKDGAAKQRARILKKIG